MNGELAGAERGRAAGDSADGGGGARCVAAPAPPRRLARCRKKVPSSSACCVNGGAASPVDGGAAGPCVPGVGPGRKDTPRCTRHGAPLPPSARRAGPDANAAAPEETGARALELARGRARRNEWHFKQAECASASSEPSSEMAQPHTARPACSTPRSTRAAAAPPPSPPPAPPPAAVSSLSLSPPPAPCPPPPTSRRRPGAPPTATTMLDAVAEPLIARARTCSLSGARQRSCARGDTSPVDAPSATA